MGQFHIDFDMDGAVDDIYSIEAYFIAKKVYIDILESRNEHNEVIQDNHIRLKSVPTSCIKHTANKKIQHLLNYSNDYLMVIKLNLIY